MKKAIAYIADVTLPRTNEVISRQAQKDLISKYAAANGIEIAGWFEDEVCDENLLARPGVQKMLDSCGGCDSVLVERVWSLSRNLSSLEALFGEMERRGAKLEATSTLWDLISQKCRRRFSQGIPVAGVAVPAAARRAAEAAAIRQPEKLNFAFLVEAPVKARP
jgi:DNA invertase Pin-like site-specific DNA recombinase